MKRMAKEGLFRLLFSWQKSNKKPSPANAPNAQSQTLARCRDSLPRPPGQPVL